jgi:diguanylate cyclase (GGDEF)-like protein
MSPADTLGRSLARIEGLIKALAYPHLRLELEAEVSELTSHVASLLAAHHFLEDQNRSLLRLSRLDDVTGLYNQRHFSERLDEEVRRAVRHALPLSLLVLGIDDLRFFVDDQGHLVGNDLLRRIATVVRQMICDIDIAGRYGGDGFAVLMPHTEREQAGCLGERLHSMIGALPERVTVTIGIASLAPWMSAASHLVADADRAMRQARAQGKNRLITGTTESWTSGTSSSA